MQDALEARAEAVWRELEAGPGEGKGSLRLGLSHERFPQHLFHCLYQGSSNPYALVATFHFQQAAVEPTKQKCAHPPYATDSLAPRRVNHSPHYMQRWHRQQ